MKAGFSLLELSIVLVIIGLLAGGVMTGKSLIRAAELRSVTSQYNQFSSAINAFRDKYQAHPGDMRNATTFWGDQATGTSACASAATADGTPGTCNGNGDGLWVAGTVANENYRAWQHLAMAGMIEGSYAGVLSVYTAAAVAGTDIPASKLGNAGWTPAALSTLNTSNNEFGYTDLPDVYKNMLVLGGTTNYWALNPILRPEEAWMIDSKMDDGKPAQGMVRSGIASCNGASGCATTTAAATAVYNLSYTSVICILAIYL